MMAYVGVRRGLGIGTTVSALQSKGRVVDVVEVRGLSYTVAGNLTPACGTVHSVPMQIDQPVVHLAKKYFGLWISGKVRLPQPPWKKLKGNGRSRVQLYLQDALQFYGEHATSKVQKYDVILQGTEPLTSPYYPLRYIDSGASH